ncbi:MAG: hypothetical protein WBG82_11075 [Parvibaculum sp.]|uniref:hypothetical protein n=1 Tax=Parvibaculum sp. TaxID=2024848 RepID=UPI003C78DCBC
MHDEDDEPHITLSDEDLDALEDEIPLLKAVRLFAEEAASMPWFAHLGEPLDRETKARARAYLDTLGFPDADIALVTDWEEAGDAAANLDFDTAQWEAEEALRAALTSDALEHVSEEGLSIALTHVSALLAGRVGAAAREACLRAGIDDEALANAAAGAAIQAAHGAALSLIAASGETHPFRYKFSLFAHGRWPIGIAGLSFNLF